jgi:tetratricopeptide (TPR) repeat protein
MDKAKFYAVQALTCARKAEDEDLVIRAKERLADVYSSTGEYAAATALLAELAEVRRDRLRDTRFDPMVERAHLCYIHEGIAINYASSGDPRSALPYFKRSMALGLEGIPANMGSPYSDLVNIGTCFAEIGENWDSVLYYFDLAHKTTKDPMGREQYQNETLVYPNKALAYAHLSQLTKSRTYAHRALSAVPVENGLKVDWATIADPSSKLGMIRTVGVAYDQISQAFASPTAKDTALKLYDTYLEGIRSIMQDSDPLTMFKSASMMATVIDAKLDLIGSQVKKTGIDPATIAALFEERRSTELRRSHQYRQAHGIDDHNKYDRVRALSHQRSLLTKAVLKDPTKREELGRVNQQLNDLSRSMFAFPEEEYANLLSRVQQRLPDHAQILSYAWTNEKLHLLAIGKDKAEFRSIGKVMKIQPGLDRIVRSLVSHAPGAVLGPELDMLRRLVPKDVLQPNVKELIILADGPLNQLPFEIIPWNDQGVLMDEFTIRYEQSLAFLLTDGQDRSAIGEVLACAPEFSPDDQRSIPTGAPTWFRSGYSPLIENVAEVVAILELFKGRSLLRKDAAKANVLGSMVEYSILHFATHAICSDSIPELSGIVLSSVPSGESEVTTGKINEILYAYEIESSSIPAEMVVLSACQTALGKERKGEGVQSLTRSFRLAGTESVVSSLWKVDDAPTKEMMILFYQNLAKGQGKATALANAKRTFRKLHPSAPASQWAAFILFGDDEPVLLDRRSSIRPWMIGTAFLLVLGAGVWLARRKRVGKAA